MPGIVRCIAVAAVCVWISAAAPAADAPARAVEIARGHSWVSPYWGYSTPKVVFDGRFYFTAGLWGATPESASGTVYRYDGAVWQEGASLPGIYQPATLLLDPQKRLVVVYNRQGKPPVFLRARKPGTADDFEELPSLPDVVSAYYVGAAVADAVVYFAYLTLPSYTMYLARLDLESLKWSPSTVVAEGQVQTKPKTAWTYPILAPAKNGLHLVASNSPDGGEGNTYNQIWYVQYRDDLTEVLREKVAESPVGYDTYAMDAVVDKGDCVHVVHMWNHRRYDDALPLPAAAPEEGTYDSYRDPKSGLWRHTRLAPLCLAGFHRYRSDLQVITEEEGTFVSSKWDPEAHSWEKQGRLIEPSDLPAPPSFVDVLQPASGSETGPAPVLVTDGLLPQEPDKPQVRVLWAVIQGPTTN